MKKLIISIGILIIGTAKAQLSNTENYVYSKTYLSDPTLANVKSSETVQYFDGLGRPKQIVNIKASPLGKDVVTPIKYDAFGRQVQDYLPVPQAGTLNGAITPDPLSNVSSTPYGTEKIYSEKVLENSPLDRILEQKQVGNAWDSKPIKFGYDANADGEVKKYTATFNYTTFTSQLTLSGSYGVGQLYKNTVTDEDGNSTIEFKNGQGQVVLVRKVISATDNADTYYVYNDYNQLSYVIPPKASVEADPNTVLNDLCYQYKYDGRNRLVEKKLPGKGWEYMVYNKADQLILTQDTELKGKGQWLFTKYDQFGRIIYTGITNNAASRASMQNSINANANLYETRTATAGWTLNGMPVYYTKLSTPTGVSQVLSVNYYDTYPAGSPAVTNVFSQPLLTDDPAQERTTKGLLTASYVKNIEDDNWTRNFLWYDTKGRNIGSRSRNYLGGYTVINNKLDFAGIVLQTNTYHKRLGTDPEKIIVEKFTYDSQNRLLTHTHQIGSNPVEYIAQNKYNELSQLESKKVGGIAAASPLQTIDYQYNIRGWMTKINDPANLNGKLFGYEMKYNNPVYTNTSSGRFNGNIAEIDWNISSSEGLKRYNYQYDALNRMLKGAYSQPNSSLAQNDYFNEELSYDLNGNIKTLKRFSWPAAGGTTAEKIDDLIYNYQNGDKSNVLDKITLPPGVINNSSGYNALQGTMVYNPNGNMTDHPDRKMKIIYNYLNLPNYISVNEGLIGISNTSYTYRADGTKVSKTYSMNGFIETNYLDGFQYDNRHAYDTSASLYTIPVLKFVPTSEGYYDFTENKYIYNYTDHLGNVRVSYRSNGSGIAEVIDANNYYPFGLKHQESPIVPAPFAGVPYNYKYNGKELQESGMYDYGARFYMPDMGRWGVVDPLAEKMTRFSPYNYAFNNPIRFIDPDGRQGTDWYQDKQTGNIAWHEGSAERAGEINLTATGNTRVVGSENGQAVQEFNLNSDGSFTANGYKVSNGESVTTLVGSTITSKQGFDLTRYLSHLGNEGGYFYSNAGGSGIGQHSPFFRPEIDKVIDLQGFAGGMLTPLAIGQFNPLMDRLEALLGVQVQAFGLIDPVKALATDNKTYEVSGNQSVGVNIYKGDNNNIIGVGAKTQSVYKSNMTRAQFDSMNNRLKADEAKYDNKVDSILRRIKPR